MHRATRSNANAVPNPRSRDTRECRVAVRRSKETRMDQTLDDVTARWNLLQHNFCQRWTRGTLTHDELCDYVRQYAHVVRAVPVWLEQVRGGDTAEGARHAAEDRKS